MPLSETHPDYEIRFKPVLGIFKTYATIDMLEARSIISTGLSSDFDLSVMWARFGQQTLLHLLKDEIHLLDELRQMIEYLALDGSAAARKMSS